MNTYIFLYPQTSLFEVNLVAYFMKTQGQIKIIAENHKYVETNEGIKVLVDVNLDQVIIDDIDALIICGGDISNITDMCKLHQLISKCDYNKKIIGGICAGREIVIEALNITKHSNATDTLGRVILSPGNEYVDFALAIGKVANIYKDEDDYLETVSFFKYFKDCDC